MLKYILYKLPEQRKEETMKQSINIKKFFTDFMYVHDDETYGFQLALKVAAGIPDDLMVVVDDPSFDTPEIT